MIKTNRIKKTLDSTAEKVSITDIIAYQIGWSKILIHWYESGLQGKIPLMPGEEFVNWDYKGLAQHFYQKYQFDSYKAQENEFYSVVTRILDITEHEHLTENLDKENVWSWCILTSGKQWPLSKWIKVNTVAPNKRAISLIRKFS